MTNLLYCFKYKNYYNREFRSLDTIGAFSAIDQQFYLQQNINNFNFGDGVSTTQCVDANVEDKDYAVLTDENDTIIARYYILECKYSRYGQYVLTLFRDLLYDYKAELSEATCYIEKGSVSIDNPLIYNKENFTVNQIKKNQIPLKDNTQIPWVVAYLKKDYVGGTQISVDRGGLYEDADRRYIEETISTFKFKDILLEANAAPYSVTALSIQTYFSSRLTSESPGIITRDFNGNDSFAPATPTTSLLYRGSRIDFEPYLRRTYNDSDIRQQLLGRSGTYITDSDFRELKQIDGKVLEFDGNKLYRATVHILDGSRDLESAGTTIEEDIFTRLRESLGTDIAMLGSGSFTQSPKLKCNFAWLELSEVSMKSVNFKVSATRAHTADSAYDIICAPYGPYGLNSNSFDDAQAALMALQQLAQDAANVEDVQILPFCPLNLTTSDAIDTTLAGKVFDYIVDENNAKISCIFYVSESSIVKNIPINYNNYPEFKPAETAVELKVQAQCDFARITNSGKTIYEFGIAQNKGCPWITVSMTCLPSAPYIKVMPTFAGLYERNFDKDYRGLILGGNFSVATLSDAWLSYLNSNKYYSQIFDRQVESALLQNKVGKAQDIINAVTGTIGAAGTGVALGSAGGLVGMAVGGAVAGAASLAAGIADVAINETLRNDSLDLKKDLFEYNNANIQAQADTTTRATSFNIDSMYFPVLEYYTCTDVEKDAFREKIKWDGMTLNIIGKLKQYWEDFVRAEIIRCPSIGDYHIMNALSNELSKGVYR